MVVGGVVVGGVVVGGVVVGGAVVGGAVVGVVVPPPQAKTRLAITNTVIRTETSFVGDFILTSSLQSDN